MALGKIRLATRSVMENAKIPSIRDSIRAFEIVVAGSCMIAALIGFFLNYSGGER
jgi:hypothetical protein